MPVARRQHRTALVSCGTDQRSQEYARPPTQTTKIKKSTKHDRGEASKLKARPNSLLSRRARASSKANPLSGQLSLCPAVEQAVCDAFCMQLRSKRSSASADLFPVQATGQGKASLRPAPPQPGTDHVLCSPGLATATAQHGGAGCRPVTRAPRSSLPSATAHTATGEHRAPAESRSERPCVPSVWNTGGSKQQLPQAVMSISPLLPGYTAARQIVKQGTWSADPEGGGTAGIALLTHLPLGNRAVSHGALSHTDVTNH